MNTKLHTINAIFSLVKTRPGISASEIAEALSISRTTAFRHLQYLLQEQKVRTQGNRKATRYFPHELVSIGANLERNHTIWAPDRVHILKEEVLYALRKEYDEEQDIEGINEIFDTYCMYIASDDTVMTGFDAFLAWCSDPKHNFADRIVEKALEYLEIIGSIEYRRKKNGLLDASETARANLRAFTKIGFDHFFFLWPSVLPNGFGRTRTAIELYYGKLNNRPLLEHAIGNNIDPIRRYVAQERVDCVIFTPPTNSRPIQFRDILEKQLALWLPKIAAEKTPPLGKILQPQKDIRDREQRVRNAFLSLQVTIPRELAFYRHILILDDSFTTGATPNAVVVKLRDAGYDGRITIITICGSFSYELSITEDEI